MTYINGIVNWVKGYSSVHPAGAVAAGIILLFILIRKPKLFFIMILAGVGLMAVMTLFDKISAAMGMGRLPFLK